MLPFLLMSILSSDPAPLAYPPARISEVVDNYHGTSVPDPYRWLEDPLSPETLTWVEAQNSLTRAFLDSPERERIAQRLTGLWNYPRYSVPSKHGGRYFFSKNDGLQDQAVLYWRESLAAEPKVLMDPNRLSPDGTVALSLQAVSEDGAFLAYGLSSKGSDSQEVRIKKVDTGEELPETLHWCKFTSIAWKHDGSGFFYNRFPEPGSVPVEDENNYCRVYWHQIGTAQIEDQLVHESPEDKELTFHPFISDDGHYLFLHVNKGTDPKNRIYYREVNGQDPFIRLLDKADARYDFIDNIGGMFYFNTDLDAPRGRVVAMDPVHPEPESWTEIIPQRADSLDFVTTAGGRLLAAYLHEAHHQLLLFGLDGTLDQEVQLPTLGSIGGLEGKREDPEAFFAFTSFLFPNMVYRLMLPEGQSQILHEAAIDFDPTGYEARQIFGTSKDGTRIPVFVIHKKGLVLDGSHPTLLYGYGGFNASLTPSFSITRVLWLEAGGVSAMANLRGGGEFGEEWHQAGILEKKQTVFDDFIAASEELIKEGFTHPGRLAIQGGSNGGLLVAACMLQHPELFGAVLCQVPVIDMLRYHKFTVGRYWVPEYGNAETDPGQFKFLYSYSPLHKIACGAVYPPILVTSADTDDRVVPLHSKKFVATLQAKAAGTNPILLRVETRAGHGGGKPTSKIIDESADVTGFLFKVFGMRLP